MRRLRFAIDDVLGVTVADKGLRHARGVDVELNRRLAASTSRWKSGGMSRTKV